MPAPGGDGAGQAQHAQASGFARIFQAAGDTVVYKAAAPCRLGEWPAAPVEPTSVRAWEQASWLLRAQEALVPFTGRQEELAGLAAWRDGDSPVAVRPLHGPGGQGKSQDGLPEAAACCTPSDKTDQGEKAAAAASGGGGCC